MKKLPLLGHLNLRFNWLSSLEKICFWLKEHSQITSQNFSYPRYVIVSREIFLGWDSPSPTITLFSYSSFWSEVRGVWFMWRHLWLFFRVDGGTTKPGEHRHDGVTKKAFPVIILLFLHVYRLKKTFILTEQVLICICFVLVQWSLVNPTWIETPD
jgi:hypothetical protein